MVNIKYNYTGIPESFDNSPSEFTKGEYSHEEAINLLTKWINNQKHQNRNMSYYISARVS